MEPLATDEIIDEIHALRLAHAAGFYFDMARILADLKQSEHLHTEQGWPLAQAPASAPINTSPQVRFAQR
jgi:hypothetical protein